MNKLIVIIGIVLTFAVQIYIPTSMIVEKENVLIEGKVFKFKTAPIDPVDPLRGKYISLDFEEDQFYFDTSHYWKRGETVYVQLQEDSLGFAKIQNVFKEMPKDESDIVKATIRYGGHAAVIQYPFRRFYMEESKAYPAELMYRNASRRTALEAYATVSVLHGEAVLDNVYINDIPIKEVVENYLDTLSTN